MTNEKVYELSPVYDSRESFYNKAMIIETESGFYLKSYETIVCYISKKGLFKKMWDGYSATTQRHISEFCCQKIGKSLGKKQRESLTENKYYCL